MIILSVGMPRAGSGWYYNLTHDLITTSGGQDSRQVRKRYHLETILTEVNCNIGVLSPRRLLAVLLPSMLGNTFVIKAHAGPSPTARLLIRLGWLKAAYIYRDPRDAMLSAFENGQRALQKGRPNSFSHLVDFESALNFMLEYVQISDAWLDCPVVLHTRYEDLRDDYDRQASDLASFLDVDGTNPDILAVIDLYRPKQASTAERKGMHFSKGKTGRFRSKYTCEQQAILNKAFEAYLRRVGYELDDLTVSLDE